MDDLLQARQKEAKCGEVEYKFEESGCNVGQSNNGDREADGPPLEGYGSDDCLWSAGFLNSNRKLHQLESY